MKFVSKIDYSNLFDHEIQLITEAKPFHKYEILIYTKFGKLIYIARIYKYYRIPPKMFHYATGFSIITDDDDLVFNYLINNNICKVIAELISNRYYVIGLTQNTLITLI